MRWLSLLAAFVFLLAAACVPVPVTPIEIVQYPATYTPAPTPTNTPHPPTATRVIQGTPGTLPTRDPNARRVPSAPQGGIGVWLDLQNADLKALELTIPRAQLFVEGANGTLTHNAKNFYLYNYVDSLPEDFAKRYDGVYLAQSAPTEIGALRQHIAPKLILSELNLQDAVQANTALEDADGVCFCNFLREPDGPLASIKSEAAWKRDVDLLASLTSQPDALVLAATRFPDDAPKDFQEMQFWLDYSLASFLMGVNNSHAFFGFQGKGAQEFLNSPSLTAKLGAPMGPAFKANGVYQRRFRSGLVLVNPSVDPHSFALPRNYVNLNGTPSTEIHMEPGTGLILLSVE